MQYRRSLREDLHTTSPPPTDTTGTPSHRGPRWRWRWNWLAYIPLLPYLVWLMVRHRSPTVFTAANPGIATGGTVGESKGATLGAVARAGAPVAVFSGAAPNS